MSQDDSRAFRPHLTGHDLYRAQERLVAAILRAPSLSPTVRIAGLGRHHFPRELAVVYDFAVRSDKDEIRRTVQNGGNDVSRLFRLGIALSHAQALQLARQIQESIARERPPQTHAPDADDSMDVVPVLTALPKVPVREVPADGNEAPASRVVAVPDMGQDGAPTEPKPSGTAAAVALVMPVLKALPRASVSSVEVSKPSGGDRLAAVVAFLRGALAQGPLDVKEIERRAVKAGLLEENMPIGKSKVFRKARAMLGVTSHQKPGRRAGGWIWSLPDPATSDAQLVAPQHSSKNSTNRVAPADAKKNVSETAQQQPAAIKAGTVDDHTANLPGAEPFAPDDPWGDLENDIVFKTETASKGIIPYPDCTALREWKKDGLDVNVVRSVVMECIKRKPVGTLFHFDKPVRERCQQVNQPRAHQSAAKPPPEPKPITDEKWTIAVKFFRDIGVWPDDLGPPPDQSGCRAPLDVLGSYGFVKAGRRTAYR
jgi:hypothetical protein